MSFIDEIANLQIENEKKKGRDQPNHRGGYRGDQHTVAPRLAVHKGGLIILGRMLALQKIIYRNAKGVRNLLDHGNVRQGLPPFPF